MKDNRRNFLKLTSLTGLGLAGGVMKGFAKETEATFSKSEPSTIILQRLLKRFQFESETSTTLPDVFIAP